MMRGVNPRQMQAMMRKMGMSQVDVPAVEVIIRTTDKQIIISNPSVQRITMGGQENFQISGNIHEQSLSSEPTITEEDITTVMEQAGVSKEEAIRAIEASGGDLAEAIMSLQGDE